MANLPESLVEQGTQIEYLMGFYMLLEVLDNSEEITTLESLKKEWRDGFYPPQGYLYFLILLLSQDTPLRIDNVATFCREWEIAPKAFHKARAKLISRGRLKNPDRNDGLYICIPPGNEADRCRQQSCPRTLDRQTNLDKAKHALISANTYLIKC